MRSRPYVAYAHMPWRKGESCGHRTCLQAFFQRLRTFGEVFVLLCLVGLLLVLDFRHFAQGGGPRSSLRAAEPRGSLVALGNVGAPLQWHGYNVPPSRRNSTASTIEMSLLHGDTQLAQPAPQESGNGGQVS